MPSASSFFGRIDHRIAATLLKNITADITPLKPTQVTIDLNRTTYFDDFGVLVLAETTPSAHNPERPV